MAPVSGATRSKSEQAELDARKKKEAQQQQQAKKGKAAAVAESDEEIERRQKFAEQNAIRSRVCLSRNLQINFVSYFLF